MTESLVFATSVLSQQTLRFVLLGLATGSLFALVSLGVVVVHRASGVLNFSAGAVGAVGAFVTYSLRDDHRVATPIALVAGIATGCALGVLTMLILGALGKASALVKLIATLGVMVAAQGFIQVVWHGSHGTPDSLLPTDIVELTRQLRITEDRLILIGVALVLAVVLWFVYSRTMFGLATAAVSENPRVAASGGWSTRSIQLANLVVAGGLSALAAILLAPILSLDGTALTLMVIPALAAALIGRFSSFGLTVGAALVIGVVQSELALFQADIARSLHVEPLSLTGLPQAVPMAIIVIGTVVTGRIRMARGEPLLRLPLPGGGVIAPGRAAVGVLVALVLLFGVDGYADALIVTFATAIVVLSLVVVTGYAGQVSLSQLALGGFGAWVAGRLVSTGGIAFPVAAVLAVVATVPIGLLVALPALRTRGVNLAVATLGLALMINALVFSNGSVTGGIIGLPVQAPTVLGVDLDPVRTPERYGAFVLLLLVLSLVVVANLRRGQAGRRLLAVRANERVAASLGVGVFGAKLYAFGVAAGIAALGGIALAFRHPNIRFDEFQVLGSIAALQYAVIGGIGWASGAVFGSVLAAGALVNRLLNGVFGGVSEISGWLLLVAGAGVVGGLIGSPDGAVAAIARGARRRAPKPAERTRPARVEPSRDRPPGTVEVRAVTVHFGGVAALHDVSLRVAPGEIVGLVGPNGAGKTTLLDIISGFTRPFAGQVLLDGEAIDRWSPERRARAGIVRSWQAVELFEEMTVRDNLLVAADRKSPRKYLTDLVHPGRKRSTDVIEQVIEDLRLDDHLDRHPSELPQGVARLVGIARVIAAEPRVLLIDEPAAGLDADESAELGLEIRRVARDRGIGVLLVEHDVPMLMSTCDRLIVLDFGREIASGTPDEVGADPAVVAAYLGTEVQPA